MSERAALQNIGRLTGAQILKLIYGAAIIPFMTFPCDAYCSATQDHFDPRSDAQFVMNCYAIYMNEGGPIIGDFPIEQLRSNGRQGETGIAKLEPYAKKVVMEVGEKEFYKSLPKYQIDNGMQILMSFEEDPRKDSVLTALKVSADKCDMQISEWSKQSSAESNLELR